ncbi:MAG: type II toxin-antitoxin system RelE/ParE family toxin [Clostridia bacterium]
MAKIRLSPLALSDLKEIKEYITDELCNPIAANRIVTKIIKDYSLLETSPKLGPSLSSIVHIDTDYRFLVSGKYIIFYKEDDEYASIYRILYGARDYIKILFSDKLTEDENFE